MRCLLLSLALLPQLLLLLLCVVVVVPAADSSQEEKPRAAREVSEDEKWKSRMAGDVAVKPRGASAVNADEHEVVAKEAGRRVAITSRLCGDDSCYVLHQSRDSAMSLQQARGFCAGVSGGPGHLATVLDQEDADMLARAIVASALLAIDGELWLGLRRGADGCANPEGPLRGFAWQAAGASGASSAVTYSGWRGEPQPRWDCGREQCVSLALINASGGISEWRQRYCEDSTGVRGVACRLSCREHACARGPRPNPPPVDGSHRPQREAPCDAGYAWVSGACEDIDECDDFGQCDNALCDNTEGGFTCDCLHGYARVNGTHCSDVDECAEQTAPCGIFQCRNGPGFYECICPPGYEQDKSGISCDDVDECLARDNGGCQHHCANAQGGYACSCNDGYELAADGRSCVDPGTTVPEEEEAPAGRTLLVTIVVLVLVAVACTSVAVIAWRRCQRRRGTSSTRQGVSALGGGGGERSSREQRVNGAGEGDAWVDSQP
ncbi:uncharacterized protein LOC116953942 [Petromyzon marinus]|uniref:uncharacterized protein LOC116953942 n=1 Tax=Petromyzon marinus TaxID=7757 RepID=UPI003F72E94A